MRAARRCRVAPGRRPRRSWRWRLTLTHTAPGRPEAIAVALDVAVIPVVTPEEMAAIDAAAPGAGRRAHRAGRRGRGPRRPRMLGGGYGRRVVVLAGKGNNGADGRAAARRLRRRGVRVAVVDALDAPPAVPPCDLVIDAAYGTGFHGEHLARPTPRRARCWPSTSPAASTA